MELTEKWLGEMGGWAAMKAARGLVDAGLAVATAAEPGLIRGSAGAGKVKFAAGLRIKGRTDVDNLCTCPSARRGLICEHSLAVALAHLRGSQPAARSPGPPPSSGSRLPPPSEAFRRPGASAPTPPPTPAPVSLKPRRVSGRYSVFLPETLLQSPGLGKGSSAVFVKFEPGEGEESILAEWLHREGAGQRNIPLSLNGTALTEFMDVLPGHANLYSGRPSGGAVPIVVADQPVRPAVVVEESGEDDLRFRLVSNRLRVLPSSPWWVDQDTATLFRVNADDTAAKLAADLSEGPARRPLSWLVENRESLSLGFEVQFLGDALQQFHVLPVPCDYEIELEGSLQFAEVALRASFQNKRWKILPQGAVDLDAEKLFPIQDKAKRACFYVRDTHGESRFQRQIEALGFVPQSGTWRLSGPDRVLRFFASELPRLQQSYDVKAGEKWRAATRGITRIVPSLTPPPADATNDRGGRSDGNWLTMEFSYQAPDGFRINRSEVLRMVRSGQSTVQGKNGKRYILDAEAVEDLEETLRDVPVQMGADSARISALHAPYLVGDEVGRDDLRDEGEMKGLLSGLKAQLRPYQLLGARWMDALIRKKRGGVLGDEMGLGKTVQSIAAILAGRGPGVAPVLVVCPKSLVGNWRSEVERFAPSLKVAGIVGAGREKLFSGLDALDVIITTYQLIINDLEIYKARKYSLILLDEASYIRNPDTEAAKALRTLQADSRLALTGTPVENTTRDLWSIYQFALPGYLGRREDFRERFELPIQNSLDTPAGQNASDRLKRLIRPYFLRRTKREVLRDLPEKIEQVLWCDPTPQQAELYRRLLEEGRDEIKAARKRSGQNGAKMTMFTVLLRLRQACCDLRLTGVAPEALKGVSPDDLSGKWAVWSERLEEIIQNDGKVLIFSQFVKFLHLMRDRLTDSEIPFCYLDGSSNDRDAQVKKFQTDPKIRVFLISLKAGGYGLNLTAADNVILTDPWWNPAVEAQAIDRAHRIGQQRVVSAYRLAIRGTVEERILALQAKKRGLVEAALDDQSPLMAGLTEGDLEGLLDL